MNHGWVFKIVLPLHSVGDQHQHITNQRELVRLPAVLFRVLIGLLLLTTTLHADEPDERYVLHYDSPAIDNLFDAALGKASPKKGKQKGLGFIQTALPLGNGRLGAMFSGGVAHEHLLINEITLWMNAKRGMDEVAQSGTRIGAFKNLDKVREAYRADKFGSKPGSMEDLSTQYLSTQEPLGNYAPFADVVISTGHDLDSVSNYRRALDSRTGLGTVSYSIGDAKFTREFFCSHPHDVVATRFTAESGKLDLVVMVSSKHKATQANAAGNRIVLTGESKMVQDNCQFMQIVQADSDGEVTANPDGTITITGATEATIMLAGYSDYLPVYPAFKGRDFKADCEATIAAATELGYEAVKTAHVDDVSELIERCTLELDFEPSGLTTDKLESGLELENLYFNYGRYLQISCSRDAPVPRICKGFGTQN